jgi:hypothetical protein
VGGLFESSINRLAKLHPLQVEGSANNAYGFNGDCRRMTIVDTQVPSRVETRGTIYRRIMRSGVAMSIGSSICSKVGTMRIAMP